MTVYFRLLAGFTSFISKRCLSHFCSIGPSGILAFSSIAFSCCLLGVTLSEVKGPCFWSCPLRFAQGDSPLTPHFLLTAHCSPLPYHPRIHCDRDDRKPRPHHHRQRERQLPPERLRRRGAEAQTSTTAPDAVVQVQPHRDQRHLVEQHHQWIGEPRDDVVVRVALDEG